MNPKHNSKCGRGFLYVLVPTLEGGVLVELEVCKAEGKRGAGRLRELGTTNFKVLDFSLRSR